jgi:hypothetical protein
MSDPAADDPLLRALAFGHPLLMTIAIAAAALAGRSGLRMRSARRLGTQRDRADRGRHLRTAKLAIAMIAVGAVGGPLSMAFLRGREPFGTAHALAGITAAVLFAGAAWLGRRLEHGEARVRDRHALVALLALLASGVAAITGFVLLP